MENRHTRSVKKKAIAKGNQVKGSLKKTSVVTASIKGEDREQELPEEVTTNSITMAEMNELIRELSKTLTKSEGPNTGAEGISKGKRGGDRGKVPSVNRE